MMDIIKITDERYQRYEKLLLERDNYRRLAELHLAAYIREFGRLITAAFEKKISCIEKKKTIAFCQMYANRGEPVDLNALQSYIATEMAEYNKQLQQMIEDNNAAQSAGTLTDGEVQKVKQIYRKIAKKIHPDIFPETSENEKLKEIWQRVSSAYNCNNLQELEELEVLLNSVMNELGDGFSEIEIPDSVVSIGNYAFAKNLKLETVKLGKNLEKIEMENQKKKEEKIRQEEEFLLRVLSNNSFEEVVQIYLKKGEKETLYLDLKAKIKIKIAIMLTDSDPEEKINFFFSGPNARGRNTVIQQYYSKNYLFWEYETLYPGEYYAEITNKGTKLNEITFLFNDESHDKKKDLINTEKIDKISMLLNNIDNNINQLRNKKKIEIKQVNSHNKKVTENNKWIVIYSIIEICTMLLVFMIQSCYISSMVDKV